MPFPQRLELSAAERAELVHLRDSAPVPYLRERAAALLNIADGAIAAQVAREGLLRTRQPDTVYAWLRRYRADGFAVGTAIRMRPFFLPPPPLYLFCRLVRLWR